ncbi:MAG TPA: response regulator [Chromatiales bacterium]|nr:response regulator [Thiotrichales bacterium]HIP67076.1 response regulator [Chromatiales bacterium]
MKSGSQLPAQTSHIMLVEDDVRLSALIQEYLEQQQFKISIEGRGDVAVQRILDEKPDLVVLDLMLPGLDGMDVCRQVRSEYKGPILMLTARDEDIDQVVGLELGADDYVIKPVKPRVLLARIHNLLRRHAILTEYEGKKSLIVIGELKISKTMREAHINEQLLLLTSQEFDLLWLLASNAGSVLSRDDILSSLSGGEYDGLDRSVDIRIARLRKLLGDNPAEPRYIKTVRSKGYLFSRQIKGE